MNVLAKTAAGTPEIRETLRDWPQTPHSLGTIEFDAIDRRIPTKLQRDGRIGNADLAEHVNLSASACLRRVRRLEENGAISGERASGRVSLAPAFDPEGERMRVKPAHVA